MYKVLQESDPLPNPLENVPIAPNDGTLRFFLNLSDSSDNETFDEDLTTLPKSTLPENVNVVKDGEFKHMPIEILEQLLGVSNLSEDEKEQQKIISFIKSQTSFGAEFKKKYEGFPQEFYDAIEREGKPNYRHVVDESGNYTLEKIYD